MDKDRPKRTIYLSRSERRIGGRLFLRFSAFNGLGVSFLGDSTVTLLAIHFGAGNLELGVISAMMHISGVALLVVPRLFKGRNVVTVAFWAWMIRGLVGIPYAALLFIDGKPAVALILALYALFCLSRTTGVSMVNTIQKRLMVSRTQSDLVFRNARSFQGSQLVSRFLSYIVLSLKALAELSGLLVLQVLGVIANTAAALTLRRIPNRTKVDYKPGESLFRIFSCNMKIPNSRRILTLRWISLSQTILFAMVIPFLRRSVGLNAAQIFLYTIAVSLGSFFSSVALRPIAGRAGSRPLLFFASIPGIAFFLIWTLIPSGFSLEIYAIAGFFTVFALNASNLAVNRLLIAITPDEGAVGFNAMETFVTSILALILGFGAGYLADLSAMLSELSPVNAYGLVFLPAALGSFWQMLITLKVRDPGSLGLRESAGIIFNIDNLRAWQTVNSLEATADPVKRKTLIQSVGHSRAPVAPVEIGRILTEPLSQEKGELIEALFFTRRPELAGFLRAEASESTSFHRQKAIFALGAYPGTETETLLAGLLSEDDPRIRALAAKSLGRIGARGYLETIRKLWDGEWRLHERLDYMIALFHLDPERRYVSDLFSPEIMSAGERSERTIFTLLSRQFGMSPPLGILYREEEARAGEGLFLVLEEARETSVLLENEELLEEMWRKKEFQKIWDLCRQALRGVVPPETLSSLTDAIRVFDSESADSANALAALYFTYQVLTAEEAG